MDANRRLQSEGLMRVSSFLLPRATPTPPRVPKRPPWLKSKGFTPTPFQISSADKDFYLLVLVLPAACMFDSHNTLNKLKKNTRMVCLKGLHPDL